MVTLIISDGLFYASLVFMFIAYLYPTIFFIKKFIEEVKKGNKLQAGNSILSVLLFLFLFYNVMYILIALRSVYGYYFLIWILTVIPTAIFWILFIGSTIWFNTKGEKPDLNEVREKWVKINGSNSLMEDIKRKSAHVAFFLILWGVIFVAIPIGMKVNPALSTSYNSLVWENNQAHPDNILYLKFLGDPSVGNSLGFVHFILIVGYIISAYGFVMFETIRHSKVLYFPTTPWFTRYLRTDEHDHIATYCFFFLSTQFTAFLISPILAIAIIGVTTIGDLMASQFGMRWGKRHITFNPKKTRLGTLAGCVGSFFISLLFVGPIYAIAATIIFFITDILTETPVKVSDNLVNPVLITIVFILLSVFGANPIFPGFLAR